MRHLRRFRQTARFLLAFFIYSDGINTVIAFGGIYAMGTLDFTAEQVFGFFALLQLAAIAGAWGFGILTDRWGAKPVVEITLAIWLVMTIWAFLVRSQPVFYAVGALAGIAMGSSQAASRALMAELTPANREAEFYGFYGLCGRFSAILGTALFGLVSSLTGSQRWAVLSIAPFFAIGWLILRRVDVTEGRGVALQEGGPRLTHSGGEGTFPAPEPDGS
jgi:UMF1 family MFS transporter